MEHSEGGLLTCTCRKGAGGRESTVLACDAAVKETGVSIDAPACLASKGGPRSHATSSSDKATVYSLSSAWAFPLCI